MVIKGVTNENESEYAYLYVTIRATINKPMYPCIYKQNYIKHNYEFDSDNSDYTPGLTKWDDCSSGESDKDLSDTNIDSDLESDNKYVDHPKKQTKRMPPIFKHISCARTFTSTQCQRFKYIAPVIKHKSLMR